MPKCKAGLKSVKKGEALRLECEWYCCSVSFTAMADFSRHVSDHIQEYLLTRSAGSTSQTVDCRCLWHGCLHKSLTDVSGFRRHVLFHVYHTKIKSIGRSLMNKNQLESCSLDATQKNIIPELPDELLCGWQHCQMSFDNPEIFYLHVANHSDVYPMGNNVPGGCVCQWAGCASVVKSKHKLRDHLKSHTQEKLVGCPVCGAIFSSMTRFSDHLKRQLDVSESDCSSFECSHCNKKFASERLLKDHMRRHVNYYQCPFCDMTCPNPSNLQAHFRYRHSNSRPFICAKCTHTCKTEHDLRRHMETHNEWIYCSEPTCDFRCHSVPDLNQHLKLTHEMPNFETKVRFLCHLCGTTYSKGHNLTNHLRCKHNFRWPPGHVRFRYNYHEDGFYRIQTVRYESIELTQQIVSDEVPINVQHSHQTAPSTETATNEETQDPDQSLSTNKTINHSKNTTLNKMAEHEGMLCDRASVMASMCNVPSVSDDDGSSPVVLGSSTSSCHGLVSGSSSTILDNEQQCLSTSLTEISSQQKTFTEVDGDPANASNYSFFSCQQENNSAEGTASLTAKHDWTCKKTKPKRIAGRQCAFRSKAEQQSATSDYSMDQQLDCKQSSSLTENSVAAPIVQTMILPTGQNVVITSDVPVEFADPINLSSPNGRNAKRRYTESSGDLKNEITIPDAADMISLSNSSLGDSSKTQANFDNSAKIMRLQSDID